MGSKIFMMTYFFYSALRAKIRFANKLSKPIKLWSTTFITKLFDYDDFLKIHFLWIFALSALLNVNLMGKKYAIVNILALMPIKEYRDHLLKCLLWWYGNEKSLCHNKFCNNSIAWIQSTSRGCIKIEFSESRGLDKT